MTRKNKQPRDSCELMCPICGYVPEEELVQKIEAEQNKPELTPKVNPIGSPMLIQGKSRKRVSKRKLYDEFGNDINQQDIGIMNDLAQGRIVKYYKETVYDTGLNDNKSKS